MTIKQLENTNWDHNKSDVIDFAVACCDSNSIEELVFALENGPDKTDCEQWGLNEGQWTQAIKAALSELRAEAEQ